MPLRSVTGQFSLFPMPAEDIQQPQRHRQYRGKPYRRTNAVHSIIEHLEPNAAEQIGKRKPYHKGIDRGIQKGEPCLPCAIGQAVDTEKYSGQKIVKKLISRR